MEGIQSSVILAADAMDENGGLQVPMDISENAEFEKRCIERIRGWITENEEFYGRTDDGFILRYLRMNKFDVEKTKGRVLISYKVREMNQKWFLRTEENEIMVEDLLRRRLMYILNYGNNDQETVAIFHSSACYPKKYCLDALIGTTVAQFSEILVEDPRLQQHGLHLVGDAGSIKLDIALQITPMLVYKLLSLMMPSNPIRIKGLHIINAPALANQSLRLIRLLLSNKLRKRFFIHKDLASLHNHLSPARLPLELGGTAGPSASFVESTIKMFRDHKEVNALNQKYGIGKRPQES